MIKRILIVAPIVVLAATASRAEDVAAAARSVLDKQVADWNRKDLDGFLQTYWNDPALVFQSGADRTLGFAAIRERYRSRYQADGKEMGRLEFSAIEILGLSGDAAFARGRWRLTFADGRKQEGLFTLLLLEKPEGWRIVHDHTS